MSQGYQVCCKWDLQVDTTAYFKDHNDFGSYYMTGIGGTKKSRYIF